MDPLKPGWQTSEFWMMLVGKLMIFLVSIGFVTQANSDLVVAQLGAAIAGIFGIVSLYHMAVGYLQARAELKTQRTAEQAHVAEMQAGAAIAMAEIPPAPASHSSPAIPPTILPFLLAALVLGLLGGAAPAQQPKAAAGVTPTVCLPWRDRVERDLRDQRNQRPQTDPAIGEALRQMAANQQVMLELMRQRQTPPAPAPSAPQSLSPQIYYYHAPQVAPQPLQVIPLGGAPLQQIPLGGAPLQSIPLGGAPLQNIQIGGPPQQQIPIGQAPLQQIPLGPQASPQQQIPLGQAPLQPPGQARPLGATPPGETRPAPPSLPMPPAGDQPQRFVPTVARR